MGEWRTVATLPFFLLGGGRVFFFLLYNVW